MVPDINLTLFRQHDFGLTMVVPVYNDSYYYTRQETPCGSTLVLQRSSHASSFRTLAYAPYPKVHFYS